MPEMRSPIARATSALARSRTEVARELRAKTPKRSFMEWAMLVPEPKAGPLDFDRFPFQRELYEETAYVRDVVVKKATQIGISAYLVRWTMMLADVDSMTVIYIFPAAKLMYDFADARVRPLITGSAYLNGRVPRANTQNKGLRQIGGGFIYYRGSESITGLESVDADALALDEYDSLVNANIPIAERRLTGSLHSLIRRVGVPSVPGGGLDVAYDESDQRRWTVQCSHDRKWQPIFYDEGSHPDGELNGFVDTEQMRVVCGKCRKPLDVGKGEWVPAFPDRDVRGYHASRLIVPDVARNSRATLTGIVRAHDSQDPHVYEVHMNRDLGEAFAHSDAMLTLTAIEASQRKEISILPSYSGPHVVTAGIDVASTRKMNMRISAHVGNNTKVCLFVGEVPDFNELEDLLARFNVQMFVIDHLPEGRLARSLIAKFPGRGLLGVLTGPNTKRVLSVDEGEHMVTVRRTEALDAMQAGIRQQRNLLPWHLPPNYIKQIQAPVRRTETDENGRTTVTYVSTGADDYAMCETFDVIATDVWAYRQKLDALTTPQITALEDRLEFERAKLDEKEQGSYSPGLGQGQGGYSAGFGSGEDEPGFDSPFDAWGEE